MGVRVKNQSWKTTTQTPAPTAGTLRGSRDLSGIDKRWGTHIARGREWAETAPEEIMTKLSNLAKV